MANLSAFFPLRRVTFDGDTCPLLPSPSGVGVFDGDGYAGFRVGVGISNPSIIDDCDENGNTGSNDGSKKIGGSTLKAGSRVSINDCSEGFRNCEKVCILGLS
jgi:hypothetical protein